MRLKIIACAIAIAALAASAKTEQVADYVCDDGWTYTGQLVDGKRQGYGSAVSKKGNFYTGDWEDNLLPSGMIVADDGNGNKWEYEGQINASFAPHGFGHIRYTAGDNAGDAYIGNFRNGVKQGLGKYVAASGRTTFGKWSAGKLSLPSGHSFKIGESIYGIDLSHHNPGIDWDNLAIYCDRKGRVHDGDKRDIKSRAYLQPVSFAYARATEGATVADSLYSRHIASARAHKIPTGSYHMMCFTTSTVDEQLANFLAVTGNCQGDELPAMLDLEKTAQAQQAGKAQVMKMALAWLKAVEKKTGRKPVVYTNDRFAARFLDLDKLKGYTLWIARYSDQEPDTHPWYLWQFTDKGRASGCPGDIDINYYDGKAKQFERRMLGR